MGRASFEETRLVVLPQRLDKTLAYKAINLIAGLSNNDKRVAATLIDSFNKSTGRCDPGLERIASMLQISERTVIRAVNRLVALGLFVRHRHGGYSNRNSYQPAWSRFREAEDGWLRRSRATSKNFRPTNLSPAPSQACHLQSDAPVTQTLISKPCNSTPADAAALSANPHLPNVSDQKWPPRKEEAQVVRRVIATSVRVPRSLQAARTSAEQAWNADLLARYVSQPDVYAEVVEFVDQALREDATDAELKYRGAGFKLVQERLRKRSVQK